MSLWRSSSGKDRQAVAAAAAAAGGCVPPAGAKDAAIAKVPEAKRRSSVYELAALIAAGKSSIGGSLLSCNATKPPIEPPWLAEPEELQKTLEVMHQGYVEVALERFLKAREYNVPKAHKMLVDCLRWRVKNDIDNILSRPIQDSKFERIRETQLLGMCGFDKKGHPIMVVRVGLSTFDKATLEEYVLSHIQNNEYRDRVLLPEASKRAGRPITTCVKLLDMTGLKLSALSRMKVSTAISNIDDLNYPEKATHYYIVNSPYVFTTCWKAVKPLLQDRTRKKVVVLPGAGKDELLQVMEPECLPHFVSLAPKEGFGSSRNLAALEDPALDCCTASHAYHREMQRYIHEQAEQAVSAGYVRTQSLPRVEIPVDPEKEGAELEVTQVVEKTIEKVLAGEGERPIEEQLNGLELDRDGDNGARISRS
eukprot:SM000055S18227  [mRNA]  locus=s55:171705:175288:- [translate_table: standard]